MSVQSVERRPIGWGWQIEFSHRETAGKAHKVFRVNRKKKQAVEKKSRKKR